MSRWGLNTVKGMLIGTATLQNQLRAIWKKNSACPMAQQFCSQYTPEDVPAHPSWSQAQNYLEMHCYRTGNVFIMNITHIPSTLGLQMHATTTGFLCELWGLNSSCSVCVVVLLPTEPSHWPLWYNLNVFFGPSVSISHITTLNGLVSGVRLRSRFPRPMWALYF